jgi:hypothetical protein
MIDNEFADKFAKSWINAWNAHDLDKILAHYNEDFEMHSPIIMQLMGDPTGRLKGKDVVAVYWSRALEALPDLKFELLKTLIGINSITLYFSGQRGFSAEVFHFNEEQLVCKAYAHYNLN